MSHAVVFWPIDIKQSGFCYGWLKPVLCVAGVFNADSVSYIYQRNVGFYKLYTEDTSAGPTSVIASIRTSVRLGLWV